MCAPLSPTGKPSLHIPLSKAQLQKLSVGETVTFTVKGKVKSLHLDEGKEEWQNRKEVQVEVQKVDFPDNEFAKLADQET